jgi:dTDP-L-rhamnose 4-epimerase
MKVLVTGGAGFIGKHLVRRLLREGCSVAVLDNFSSQVHGREQELPLDLASDVELYRGDVRDRDVVVRAIRNRDALVHLAAETGTGQSMYAVGHYQEVNIGGTATILDLLVNQPNCTVNKFVVASSRAVYGEGKYRCQKHQIVYPTGRKSENLQAGQFEPCCPVCGNPCVPVPTSEDSPSNPLSFYGLTKKVQEEMVLLFARSRGFSAHAIRYQNVYGPGQSLSNPYTGILAIFSSLARANSLIQIFEDGEESRDFVFVDDAVEATYRCLRDEARSVEAFNVGSGQRTTVLHVAKEIARFFGSVSEIAITGAFRQGDIRHNYADLSKLQAVMRFTPQFSFHEGLKQFLDWVEGHEGVSAGYESSLNEMRQRGLLHG